MPGITDKKKKPGYKKCNGKKCEDLGIIYPKEELKTFPTNNKAFYCAECYITVEKTRKARQELEWTVFQYFEKTPEKRTMIRQQMAKLEKDGISIEDMRKSIEYFLNVEKGHLTGGLNIIPYVYHRMKEHEQERERKLEALKNVNTKTRTIRKITMPFPEKKFDYRESKLVSLEDIRNAIGKH